jgi:urease accessory protein
MAQKVQFQDRLSTALLAAGSRPEFDHHNGHGHGHDHGGVAHLHDAATGTWTPVEHGHTHEHLENPGGYRFYLVLLIDQGFSRLK